MKNKIFSRLAAFAAFLLTMSINSQLNAQCTGLVIKNNSTCEATINYVVSCAGGGSCPSGSNIVLLENGGQITVPACSNCQSGSCRVTVTIIKSGTSVISPGVSISSPTSSVPYPSPCPPASHTLNWVSGMVTIN